MISSMSENPNLPTVVDLFSGAGGMSSGFRRSQAGYRIIGAVDREVAKPSARQAGASTHCNSTYEANVGVRPKNADLATLDPVAYREELGIGRGELGVLISCAPCTGFSQKNARNHIEDDPRNVLVRRTGEFVEAFMPEFLVMENVKELLTGNQGHHFDGLYDHLRRLGYDVWAEVHNLTGFGLPQRRIRALVVARRDGAASGPEPWCRRPVTVRETIGHLPPLAAGEADPSDPMHRSPGMTQVTLDRIKAMPRDGGSWADVMTASALSEEEKHRLLTPRMFTARPGSFPDIYGRLWWDRPAVTITRECGHVGNGRYSHPEQDRLVTVREMALLQGFPKDYYFHGPISAKYNQIGDAVPPLVSEQIADHVAGLRTGAVRARPAAIPPRQFEIVWPQEAAE